MRCKGTSFCSKCNLRKRVFSEKKILTSQKIKIHVYTMQKNHLKIEYSKADFEDFSPQMQSLIEQAQQETAKAYAPYSGFSVGAAVLLADGTIVCGSNQENIAYPSGLCAERTAMFYANAHYPDTPPIAIAIAARNKNGMLPRPICPCGSCRQALLESEIRYKKKIKVILYGTQEIYLIDSIADMLPFAFVSLD